MMNKETACILVSLVMNDGCVAMHGGCIAMQGVCAAKLRSPSDIFLKLCVPYKIRVQRDVALH